VEAKRIGIASGVIFLLMVIGLGIGVKKKLWGLMLK